MSFFEDAKKFIDFDALSYFVGKLRDENQSTYLNSDNSVTNEDIDSIFGAAKGKFSVIAGLDDSGESREFEFETGMTWGEYINSEYNDSIIIDNNEYKYFESRRVECVAYNGGRFLGAELVEIMDGGERVDVLLSDPIKPATYYIHYLPM